MPKKFLQFQVVVRNDVEAQAAIAMARRLGYVVFNKCHAWLTGNQGQRRLVFFNDGDAICCFHTDVPDTSHNNIYLEELSVVHSTPQWYIVLRLVLAWFVVLFNRGKVAVLGWFK